MSGCPRRCLSICEVGLTGDGFQRNLGKGFGGLLEFCRGLASSTCYVSQRRLPDLVHAVRLETRPESQLAGFSTAPEGRNTVVNDVFVHATRFNHP